MNVIVASLDTSRLMRALAQFPGQTQATQDKLLNDNVRLLISSSGDVPGIVQILPPSSKGVSGIAAKKQGEKAVTRDIARVYKTPGGVYADIKAKGEHGLAKSYWNAYKRQDFAAMAEIAKSVPGLPSYFKDHRAFDGGAEHLKRRGSDGRVKKKNPSFVITTPASLKAYRRRKLKNVGLLASAVPRAYNGRYGALKGVPAWVRRHAGKGGFVREEKSRAGRTVIIGMTSSFVSDLQRPFNYVLKYRLAAIDRQLPYMARQLEKQLDAHLNA